MVLASLAFVLGAAVSLATSWVLISRLERVGERVGLSEVMLGVLAALAADAPEITSSISALTAHQFDVGTGVVLGSNVFNLAAMLGLAAIVSGFVALHRRVVVLGGSVAVWVALCAVLSVTHVLTSVEGFVLALLVFLPFLALLNVDQDRLSRLGLPVRWSRWLESAISEEAHDLEEVVRARRGRPIDAAVALVALAVVVVASIAMERGATSVGHHLHVANAITGGVVLAAVTSMPNAVAAIYLARRGRSSASFSTALSSNNLNVVVGLLLPGTFLGLAPASRVDNFIAFSFVGLTAFILVAAFVRGGLTRRVGWLTVGAYAAFIVTTCVLAP